MRRLKLILAPNRPSKPSRWQTRRELRQNNSLPRKLKPVKQLKHTLKICKQRKNRQKLWLRSLKRRARLLTRLKRLLRPMPRKRQPLGSRLSASPRWRLLQGRWLRIVQQ